MRKPKRRLRSITAIAPISTLRRGRRNNDNEKNQTNEGRTKKKVQGKYLPDTIVPPSSFTSFGGTLRRM